MQEQILELMRQMHSTSSESALNPRKRLKDKEASSLSAFDGALDGGFGLRPETTSSIGEDEMFSLRPQMDLSEPLDNQGRPFGGRSNAVGGFEELATVDASFVGNKESADKLPERPCEQQPCAIILASEA